MDIPAFSGETLWHTLATSRALDAAGVEEQRGLRSDEVAARADRFGPNKFTEAKTDPRWRAFLRGGVIAEFNPAFLLSCVHRRFRSSSKIAKFAIVKRPTIGSARQNRAQFSSVDPANCSLQSGNVIEFPCFRLKHPFEFHSIV